MTIEIQRYLNHLRSVTVVKVIVSHTSSRIMPFGLPGMTSLTILITTWLLFSYQKEQFSWENRSRIVLLREGILRRVTDVRSLRYSL